MIVEANTDIPAGRSVSLALLCSQLAELSRLRSTRNSVDVLNKVDDHLDTLVDELANNDMDKEERLQKAELRYTLIARRDSALKRIAAEQHLVTTISKLEEELGIASVKIEATDKLTLAKLVDEGSYMSDTDGLDELEGLVT